MAHKGGAAIWGANDDHGLRLGQRQMAMIEAAEQVLVLKRAAANRSSGDWKR
jgi:hypothetical protein